MTGAAVLFGLLAGLDNLQVCTAISACTPKRRSLLPLAAMFSAFEVLSTLGGLILGHTTLTVAGRAGDLLGPVFMLVCGTFVVAGGMRRADALSTRVLISLPLSLSVDNFAAGAAFGVMGHPLETSLVIGAMGALMSCLGLFAGSRLRYLAPRRIEAFAGFWLCLLAFRIWAAK